MLKLSETKIKEYLLANKLLAEEKLQEMAGKDIGLEEFLVEKNGYFLDNDFNKVKSAVFGLESADLEKLEIKSETLNLLSAKVAKNYEMVIFERSGNQVKVGLVDPGNFQSKEAMEFLASQQGLTTQYFVISLSDFRLAYRRYSGFQEEIGTALESAKVKFAEKIETQKTIKTEEDLALALKNAPVAKVVSVIIQHGVEGRASDIHIEPSHEEGRVRYRVDGHLHTSLSLPGYLYTAIVSRIKVLANLKLDENRIPQDGRIRANVDGRDVDLRVSILPMLDQEKVVMRILDTSAGVPTLKELGFAERHIAIIDRNIKKPHGLFLLTGPTGSGKTTTLYSILNTLNAEAANITTLEDPIEYYITGVNQSQINPQVGYTFASGLRAILRQDPNIIMVGEIRDSETAELAIHAGLTGHLVFSTLHTNSAWGAVPRLIDMKAEPFLLASTLNLVMAQRLVRKLCPHCRKEEKITPRLKEMVQSELAKIPAEYQPKKEELVFYRGEGCKICANSGYISRTVVGEILEIDRNLQDLVARGFTMEKVDEQLKKQKFVSLMGDGVLKALAGDTTIEEILRVSQL